MRKVRDKRTPKRGESDVGMTKESYTLSKDKAVKAENIIKSGHY